MVFWNRLRASSVVGQLAPRFRAALRLSSGLRALSWFIGGRRRRLRGDFDVVLNLERGLQERQEIPVARSVFFENFAFRYIEPPFTEVFHAPHQASLSTGRAFAGVTSQHRSWPW